MFEKWKNHINGMLRKKNSIKKIEYERHKYEE